MVKYFPDSSVCVRVCVCVCVYAAANLDEPRFIPGRYRRDLTQPDAAAVTDSSINIHTTSADDGLST